MQNLPKFRLWHIPTRCMYEVQVLLLNFKKAYVTPFTLRTADDLPETMQVDLSDDQSVLMQFTGVVDGHDVPIYEGDIVEHFYEKDKGASEIYDYYRRYPVVLACGGFGEHDKDESRDFNAFSRYNHVQDVEDKVPLLWVCGNTYEHPDWENLDERNAMRADLRILD